MNRGLPVLLLLLASSVGAASARCGIRCRTHRWCQLVYRREDVECARGRVLPFGCCRRVPAEPVPVPVPEPDCREVPCKKGTYCRLNQLSGDTFGCAEDGQSSCVPYVKEGEGCGGFTLACHYRACDPAVHKCVTNPMIPDAPGICQKKVLELGDRCKVVTTGGDPDAFPPVDRSGDFDRSGDCAEGYSCVQDAGASGPEREVHTCAEKVVPGPVDCGSTLCPADYPPTCGPGEEWYIPEGGCCVKCRKVDGVDCSLVDCPFQGTCPFGSHVPHGECCSKCNSVDCRLVRCAFPKCKNGVQPVKAPGACCLSCPPAPLDCSATLCAIPTCPAGAEAYTPEGECCPRCRKCEVAPCLIPPCPVTCEDVGDCNLVRCKGCTAGEVAIKVVGSCCPKCEPAFCADKGPMCGTGVGKCKPGYSCTDVPNDGCNPSNGDADCAACCVRDSPDCSATLCAKPACPAGAEIYTPEGECCPRCRKCEVAPCLVAPCPVFCNDVEDCNLVDCKDCAAGEVAVKVDGSCCPKCEPAAPCQTSCGRTVPHGWSGNDDGSNYCNHCSCHDGGLGCTRIGCLEKRDPVCLKKGDVCKLGGVDTGKGPDRSEECPTGTFCTEGGFDEGGHATFTCQEPQICCLALPQCKQGFSRVLPTECTEAEFLSGTCVVEAMCCRNLVCKRSASEE